MSKFISIGMKRPNRSYIYAPSIEQRQSTDDYDYTLNRELVLVSLADDGISNPILTKTYRASNNPLSGYYILK